MQTEASMTELGEPETVADDVLDDVSAASISGGQAGAVLGGALGGQLELRRGSSIKQNETTLDS